jgi:hypothetical protein
LLVVIAGQELLRDARRSGRCNAGGYARGDLLGQRRSFVVLHVFV